MKNAIVLVLVSVFLISLVAPAATGSYLNVTIYPDKGLANIKLNSDASLIFTYPANGTVSKILNGTSYTKSFSLNFTHPSDRHISFMEGWLKSRYHNISVENMSIIYNVVLNANKTTLVLTKLVTINLWVTGIFNKTKSETKVNMSWKAFEVKGNFKLSYENETYDLNLMEGPWENMWMFPPLFQYEFQKKYEEMNNVSTLNYTMFAKSLSTWQRTYNPTTNTTTFYYNASKYLLFNAIWTINNSYLPGLNGTYTLKIVYDPASTITVPGYATASGDTIIISPTAPSNTLPLIIAAVVVLVVVVGALAFFIKKKK
ncbi:MAG: hypothetical protein QXE07_05850 [Thermoplasmata archaeon]